MQDIVSSESASSSLVLIETVDDNQPPENVEEEAPPHQHHHPHHHPRPREPRTAPFLFPTLGDLPGLLVSSIGSIFHDSQVQHLRSRLRTRSLDDLGDVEPESEHSLAPQLEETWSQFLRRIGKDRQQSHESTLDTLYLLNYQWPGKHREVRPDHSSSKDALKYADGIHLKQVISSELDAFITALQQDKKKQPKINDADSVETEAAKLISYRRGVYFILFLLALTVAGNVAAGVYLVMSKF